MQPDIRGAVATPRATGYVQKRGQEQIVAPLVPHLPLVGVNFVYTPVCNYSMRRSGSCSQLRMGWGLGLGGHLFWANCPERKSGCHMGWRCSHGIPLDPFFLFYYPHPATHTWPPPLASPSPPSLMDSPVPHTTGEDGHLLIAGVAGQTCFQKNLGGRFC